MSETSLESKKYSRIQYFFWLLSGCEISILKDCPTDYNRQAGIGFTIFMTTVLAFCSGSYAGYYFGESTLTAIIFGLIWSSLIFSIDRSMVVTLKKDPTKDSQQVWPAFLSRAVLAILIAFIISIPLELLIFRDSIEIHKSQFIQNKTLNVMYNQQTIQGIDAKNQLNNTFTNQIEDIQKKLEQGEPQGDPTYNSLKNDVIQRQKEYNGLLAEKNKWQIETTKAYGRVPKIANRNNFSQDEPDVSTPEWKTYDSLKRKSIKSNNNFKRFDKKGLDDKNTELTKYIKDWGIQNKTNQTTLERKRAENTAIIDTGHKIVANAAFIIDSIIKKHNNSFVFNFMVLEDMATSNKKVLKPVNIPSNNQDSKSNHNSSNNGGKISQSKLEWTSVYDPEGATILFLLWLIRILFFVVEVLPTIAKIATPIGAYDRAIYRKEKDLEIELEQKTSGYLEQQKLLRELEYSAEEEQLRDRTKIENKLHKELLTEIATVQDQVARKKIEEFKQKHLQ